MALSTNPVFPQSPKSAGIAFGTTSHSTQMDPATVAPTTLVTAGADGAVVTSVVAHGETTVALEKFVLWIQPGGTGNWYALDSGFMAAYTQAATDAQAKLTLVDKTDPLKAVRLAGADVLGITHHIDQQSMVVAEYTDY